MHIKPRPKYTICVTLAYISNHSVDFVHLYLLTLTFIVFSAAEMSDYLNTTTHNATEDALDTRLRPYQFASLTIITCVSFVVNVAILASVAKKKYTKKPYHLLVGFYHIYL